jgi:hypothetical protein
MSAPLLRRATLALVLGLAVVLSSGCAVGVDGGYGYGYDDSVRIGVDYYAPYGIDYGGWGPGYRVGPYRGGERRTDRVGDSRHSPRAFRSAPAGRAIPSIPQRSAGGGRRSR